MELPLGCDFLDVNDDVFQNGQNKVTCKAKYVCSSYLVNWLIFNNNHFFLSFPEY